MTADVRLVAVDEAVLDRLVEVAVTDAAPDEVTPPLSAGVAWTAERITWLRTHHIHGRAGGGDEQTWAVVVDGDVAGAVRLRRLSDADLLEAGIWLAWSVRGRGLAATAVEQVAMKARDYGAAGLQATTDADNTAALAVLRRLGFALGDPQAGRVTATLRLDGAPPSQGP